jgi:hypothetical protein
VQGALAYDVHAQEHLEEAVVSYVNALDFGAYPERRRGRERVVSFRPNANVEKIRPVKFRTLDIPNFDAAFSLQSDLLN